MTALKINLISLPMGSVLWKHKNQDQHKHGNRQQATSNIQHAAAAAATATAATITESNDEKMMKTSKVAKHEMATKIIFSQALGVCAELRT